MVQNPQFLTHLIWKCASRHNDMPFFDSWTASRGLKVARACDNFNIFNGAHFFLISPSRIRPKQNCFDIFHFEMCFAPQGMHFFHILTFIFVGTPRVLLLFTSACASRHNGVHFVYISTSKDYPRMVCFIYSYFKMSFAPQRRAHFRHLNFQKLSENGFLELFM